jgi:hypothetical protein
MAQGKIEARNIIRLIPNFIGIRMNSTVDEQGAGLRGSI